MKKRRICTMDHIDRASLYTRCRRTARHWVCVTWNAVKRREYVCTQCLKRDLHYYKKTGITYEHGRLDA